MNSILQEDIRNLAELPFWQVLAGKRLLITGATGMLGACIALAATEANIIGGYGIKLYLIGRDEKKAKKLFTDLDSVFIQQDVRETPKITVSVDYIIHTAGPVGPVEFSRDPLNVISVNTEGTLSLLRYAAEQNCSGFVFTSTHEVYGVTKGEKYENDKPEGINLSDPRSCYILGKQTAENALVCAAKQYGLRAMSARLSRLYGPLINLDSGLFICDFLKDVLDGRPVRVRGGLNMIKPLCYIMDAAEALLCILIYGEAGEAYNVQGGETPTIGDIVKKISDNVIIDKPETGMLTPSGHWLNTNKLRAVGWQQCIPLADGLKRTLAYLFEEQY